MKSLLKSRIRERRPIAAAAITLWVALAPWLWGFAGSRSAVANHVFFVFAFGPTALMIAVLRPAAFVTLLGGIWLALSPWLLGYAANHTAWVAELVTGGLLIVLSAHATGVRGPIRVRRERASRRATLAGSVAADAASSHP